jgi:hypothetical protein
MGYRALVQRWRAYWLAPGGRYATAIVRIGIALSCLWMLVHYAGYADLPPTATYYKLGVWMLYPGRPGPAVIEALLAIGWIASVLFLFGAWTRVAHVVSLLALLAVAAHGVSDTPTWSHTDAPPLLASIAFLGARGDAWSIDAWLRRGTARALHQGPVRLAQFAVALIFAVACFKKLQAGGGLGWAFSDSLRHHLLVRFDWIGLPRTPIANWLLQSNVRYELAAALNLVSQLTPLLAIFLVRFPKLRALAGACFILEVLGLGFVMDLWNLHWLPLAVVFVDADALLGRREPVVTPPRRWTQRLYLAWATLFVAFFLAQAFWLNQRLRAFPFSSFPMFAQVRAKQPYDEHQTYELPGGHIEVFGARTADAEVDGWFRTRGTFRWMWRHRDRDQVRADLAAMLADVRQAFPAYDFTRVRYSIARFQAPAYPEPARLVRTDLAILGELTLDGTFTSELGTRGPYTVIVDPVTALPYLVVERDGQHWLVAP